MRKLPNVLITAVEDFPPLRQSTPAQPTQRSHMAKDEPARKPRKVKRLRIRRSLSKGQFRQQRSAPNHQRAKPSTAVNYVLSSTLGHSLSSGRLGSPFQPAPDQPSLLTERQFGLGVWALTLKTEEENRTIKEKLAEYDELYRKKWVPLARQFSVETPSRASARNSPTKS